MMNINDTARQCWQTSEDHGFHDDPRSIGDVIALIHSELSEALEAARKGEPMVWMKSDKPDGIAVELVDAIIRIYDYLGDPALNIDIEEIMRLKMAYNATRPYKHGKRF